VGLPALVRSIFEQEEKEPLRIDVRATHDCFWPAARYLAGAERLLIQLLGGVTIRFAQTVRREIDLYF